jgi:hypothetical protein
VKSSEDTYQLFVADGGTQWLGPCYVSLESPEALRIEQARDRILNDFVLPFAGTGTDALVLRIDAGNQFLCYDTKVGEPVTDIQPRLEQEYGLTPRNAGGGEYVSFPNALGWWRLAENFRLLREHNFDPWTAIIETAHHKGIQVFFELQINQADAAIYYLDGSGLPASRFLLDHPDYLLGYECHRTDLTPAAEQYRPMYQAPAPDGDTHSKPETAFCTRLDFGREEVRRYRLAVIEELCERYELDGLQINFCADPHFFKQGAVDAGRELMTRFLADVKATTSRIGQERGRPIRSLARFFVHRGLESLRDNVGLDIVIWIRNGSVDVIAPVVSSTTNEHIPRLEECVKAARDSQCQVLAGISDVMSDQYTQIRPSTEMLQAANLLIRDVGASGLHISWPREQSSARDYQRPQDFSLLEDLKSAAVSVDFDKHYLLGDQLPRVLREGNEDVVRLIVADDLLAPVTSSRVEKVILVIGLRHFTPDDEVRFSLNGNEISWESFVEPDFRSIWYRVGRLEALLTDLGVRQGVNEIGIMVDRHVPDPEGMTLPREDTRRPDNLILTNLELTVTYKRDRL